jgi:nitrate reductase gamma subunit
VEAWIQFGRGPLFRLAFSLMVLGLLRIVALTMVGVVEAYRRSPDKMVNWREVRRQTFAWLVPLNRFWHERPAYSTVSILFHAGLLLVPLFLAAHTALWRSAAGFAWPALPQRAADYLTCLAILAGLGLFFSRLSDPASRRLSRQQDYVWPLLLVTPFLTGFVCSNLAIGAKAYQTTMLIHIYSADLIMVLIPFTKIAHCVLAPLSQLVTAVAWKFPAGAGDRVAATLGYAERPTWVKGAKLGLGSPSLFAPAEAKPVSGRTEEVVKK